MNGFELVMLRVILRDRATQRLAEVRVEPGEEAGDEWVEVFVDGRIRADGALGDIPTTMKAAAFAAVLDSRLLRRRLAADVPAGET
ncbi:MAG: hypothetical protein KC583_03220 [Myxococcales bacterium]|nr:hypothetical protein [Myxococcales bacterium]